MKKLTLVALASAAMTACATAPATNDSVVATEAPMRAAEELGAAKVPEAALELQYARDQTEQAKVLLKSGDTVAGNMMLQRAQADAELALALAKEAPLQAEAKAASDQAKALQTSNQAGTP